MHACVHTYPHVHTLHTYTALTHASTHTHWHTHCLTLTRGTQAEKQTEDLFVPALHHRQTQASFKLLHFFKWFQDKQKSLKGYYVGDCGTCRILMYGFILCVKSQILWFIFCYKNNYGKIVAKRAREIRLSQKPGKCLMMKSWYFKRKTDSKRTQSKQQKFGDNFQQCSLAVLPHRSLLNLAVQQMKGLELMWSKSCTIYVS